MQNLDNFENEQINCACGGHYKRKFEARHYQTKRHRARFGYRDEEDTMVAPQLLFHTIEQKIKIRDDEVHKILRISFQQNGHKVQFSRKYNDDNVNDVYEVMYRKQDELRNQLREEAENQINDLLFD